MADAGEAEAEEGCGGEAGGADPPGRGFPLIQVCAEGERGGQKTDILQPPLLPGVVAPRSAAFSLGRHFLKPFFRFPFRHFWPRTG